MKTAVGLMALFIMSSCGGGSGDPDYYYRVVNLSPDTAQLKVDVNGKRFSPLSYGEALPYRGISQTIDKIEAIADDTLAFSLRRFSFSEKGSYTFCFLNRKADGWENILLNDNDSLGELSNRARVRFFNAGTSLNQQPIEIYIFPFSETFEAQETPNFQQFSFQSITDFRPFRGGQYKVVYFNAVQEEKIVELVIEVEVDKKYTFILAEEEADASSYRHVILNHEI